MENNYRDMIDKEINGNIIIRNMHTILPFQYIGEKVLSLLGYTSKEELYLALDGAITRLIHPDDIQFVANRVKQQIADFGEYIIEYRVRKKDGSYIWIQDKGKRVEITEKKQLVICTFFDLSKQKLMGISDEARLYGDIIQQSTNGVYVIEKKTYKLLYVNKAMKGILAGVDIKDYLGKKCYCALRQREYPCEECFINTAENISKQGEAYLDFLSKYYSVTSHSIEWRGLPAYVVYLSDISDGKIAECELKRTKQKLTAAIDHAGLAYWEYDIANSRAYLNTISTEEYSLNEVLDNYPESLYAAGTIYPECIKQYDEMIQAVKSGAPTAMADIKTVDANADLVWKRVRFTTLFDEKNMPFWAIATAESINEYKDLENRFSTVLEQNHIDTWLYDLKRCTIIQNHNTEHIYGIHGTEITNVPESLIEKKQCYVQDVNIFRNFYKRLHDGEKQVSVTARL
ncbi:MAG: PAS domain-containing protein, partial [Oscillospiraceae bacterium]